MPAERDPIRSSPEVSEETLSEVVTTLAPIDRTPCSSGERRAAEWLGDRFRTAGCSEVVLEEEPAWGTWPPNVTALGALSILSTLLVVAGRRVKGAVLSLLALAGFLDEVANGPRIFRRAVRTKKTTTNVVASIGKSDAERTLVVLAHHDAAQTGRIFDQTWARTLHRAAPERMEKAKNQVPQWWTGVAGCALTVLAALTGWKRAARWALGIGLVETAAVADIARSPTVPGANDNLSGVAVLVAMAEALNRSPLDGVRVLLVSCGAEETFQEGIRAFMDRHRNELIPGRTWFLNFDTVGSPHLVLLEGEGPIWMEHYTDPAFRDLVERCAEESGIAVERGIRARASTDSVIPSRAGYPTAGLISLMPWRMPGNYHLMTDVPENLDYSVVADATRLGLRVASALARGT